VVHGPVTGPDLAGYRADPVFLRRWLRDPQAVRPATRMPDLGLSDAEIEALSAFLEDGGER
jgi:cytochrome c1